MSFLGIDVGTTGCKAIAFTLDGDPIAQAHREYDLARTIAGHVELDAGTVWRDIMDTIAQVAAETRNDPVQSLSVTSMGEAMVPVTADRRILGPSLMADDARGAEYVDVLQSRVEPQRLYEINGNALGNHFGVTKLMWQKEHDAARYEAAHHYLLWSGFVLFMLGAEATVDYSLANRTLLLDLDQERWSSELLRAAGLDEEKLPRLVRAGTVVGTLSRAMATQLGLPESIALVAGGHDQCVCSLGTGVVGEGVGMLGMGTYHCIVLPFGSRPAADVMRVRGLNTEHHVAAARFVTFIYNHGGSYMKWFRDTFAAAEAANDTIGGDSVYGRLCAELPSGPSGLAVLPHFAPTGPPEFIEDSCGVIAGLRHSTSRGTILKALLESVAFSLRQNLDNLKDTRIETESLRVVGGGSRSDAWLQLYADILDLPLRRTCQAEAGALGAAMLAATAFGAYNSLDEAAAAMLRLADEFEPDPQQRNAYAPWYERHQALGPLMREYTRRVTRMQA